MKNYNCAFTLREFYECLLKFSIYYLNLIMFKNDALIADRNQKISLLALT